MLLAQISETGKNHPLMWTRSLIFAGPKSYPSYYAEGQDLGPVGFFIFIGEIDFPRNLASIAKKQPHDTCVSYGCFPEKENFFIREALRLAL